MDFVKNGSIDRRRLKSNDHTISASSSCSESEHDTEIENILLENRKQLENTQALKMHTQHLRPDDYVSHLNEVSPFFTVH